MGRSPDTIAAVATVAPPPGRGGVGIIRVSGSKVVEIATQMLGHCPIPRHADYLPFKDNRGDVIDNGIALYFPNPHSFTGEDVLELQGHGGPVVLDMLLSTVLSLGVRPARPGEFSERAFLNGKLDLAQAEAIADLIDSSSEQAARSAVRSLQGEFSRQVHELVQKLIELRIYVESAIDFPEEEIDFLSEGNVAERLKQVQTQLADVKAAAKQGCLLKEGMTLVIAGQPNAGKSSLLNALAGQERAIVTDIPGTTRDVLREEINIDGMPVHIVDTAGLRESSDQVEQEGIRRAWDEISRADRVLLVVDEGMGVTGKDQQILAKIPENLPVSLIRNKVDLYYNKYPIIIKEVGEEILISAKTGQGVDQLRQHLKSVMGFEGASEGGFMARRRHLDAIDRAEEHLQTGRRQLETSRAGELLAEDLRQAQEALSEITGEFHSDDLLGEIFSSFCIGK